MFYPRTGTSFRSLRKEATHEVGEPWDLKHCFDWQCVMSSSHRIERSGFEGGEIRTRRLEQAGLSPPDSSTIRRSDSNSPQPSRIDTLAPDFATTEGIPLPLLRHFSRRDLCAGCSVALHRKVRKGPYRVREALRQCP